jgi:hypothetical protein
VTKKLQKRQSKFRITGNDDELTVDKLDRLDIFIHKIKKVL